MLSLDVSAPRDQRSLCGPWLWLILNTVCLVRPSALAMVGRRWLAPVLPPIGQIEVMIAWQKKRDESHDHPVCPRQGSRWS
jgi:hypothetical protein